MAFKRTLLGAVVVGALVGPGFAEDKAPKQAPAPFPEFKAKRIKPPKPGAGKRITIQIDPSAQTRPTPAAQVEGVVAQTDPSGTQGRYAWFWNKVTATEPDSPGPGRLFDAVQALKGEHTVAAPRLQALQDIARDQGIPILTSTVGTNVSPALVLAVIAVESSGRADAVSGAGAQGLMQLMPATAAEFDVTDSLNPKENIAGGVRYLDWLMGQFNQDPILVLAGYNAGPGSVREHKGVPPFAETRDYVPKVLAAFQVAKGLCKTPPELISDGCVFSMLN